MKVLPLKGYESLKAANAFHTLMLGLKMLPAYMGEQYEDFYARIEAMDAKDQERLIREAVLFVPLQREEVEAMVCFVEDPNGVPYGKSNIKNLGPKELIECIVAVAKEIASIPVNFISESEKKN